MLPWRKNKNAVRYAKKKDLPRINELRRQLHELHQNGSPDNFQMPFGEKLGDEVNMMFRNKSGILLVAEREGEICGFIYGECTTEKESLYRLSSSYCAISEMCVDDFMRGQGIGTDLLNTLRAEAAGKGFARLKLNVWEFNAAARAFWEKQGFTTYMRCMELCDAPAVQDGE